MPAEMDPMKAVYAEVGLKHAIECDNSKCSLESCKYLKSLLDHISLCSQSNLNVGEVKESVNSSCDKCIEYWDLVKLHAKKCRVETCPITNCKLLRPSSMRKKLMAKKSTGSSGASIKGGSDGSSLGGSFVSENGGSGVLKPVSSVKSLTRKHGSFESLEIVAGSGSGSELPRVSSMAKGLKATSSFISVGTNGENMVPIIAADETYNPVKPEDLVHENVANPMFGDEEMGEIPRAPRKWFACFGA